MAEKASTALMTACFLAVGLACASIQAAANTDLQAELEAARQELRLRSETERRMREEFEALLANGRMSAVEIADFESYLAGLGTMVDEQRRVVAELQGTGSERKSSPAAPLPGDFDRGQTDAEKIAMLDSELGSSLSEFDEKLLREQKEIAEKSRAASTGDGAEGNGSQGSGGASGEAGEGEGPQAEGDADGESASGDGESASDSSGDGGESGQQTGAGQRGDTSGEGAGGDEQVASTGGSGDAHSRSSTPEDIPDGKDDDIVARQLREAAESEEDPELREKLWEEYRKYKQRAR